MFDLKEAYTYKDYLPGFDGATIREVPGTSFYSAYKPSRITHYQAASMMADGFMEIARSKANVPEIDNFMGQKVELSEDKTRLILADITQRNSLKYDNLIRLYDDLLRIDNWRCQRGYPQNYATDKPWSDLNKMEMQVRNDIRRELKDASKDIGFNSRDLREGLLEFKVNARKEHMLDDGLESSTIESSLYNPTDTSNTYEVI
jgi:hypothetical protein